MAEKPEKKPTQEEYRKSQAKYLANLKDFAYGGVAGKALAEKNFPYANISLEKLASDMGLDDDDRLEGFVKGTFSSEKGIQTAASIYGDRYEISRARLTVSNLWKSYDEYSTKFLGDLKAKAEEEISKFKDIEYGEVKDRYNSAVEIVKSKTKNFTEEQKEKAKKQVEEYQKVVGTLEILNKAYLRKYENSTDEQVDINTLKQIFSEKEKGK
jgi:hypothetical protein